MGIKAKQISFRKLNEWLAGFASMTDDLTERDVKTLLSFMEYVRYSRRPDLWKDKLQERIKIEDLDFADFFLSDK